MSISYRLGRRHVITVAVEVQFQIRDQFWIPRRKLHTRGMLLEFFVTSQNMLVWLVTAIKVFFRDWFFYPRRATLSRQIKIALHNTIPYALSMHLCNVSTAGHRRSTVSIVFEQSVSTCLSNRSYMISCGQSSVEVEPYEFSFISILNLPAILSCLSFVTFS